MISQGASKLVRDTSRERPAAPVAQHVLVGLLTAVVATAADAVFVSLDGSARRVAFGPFTQAMLVMLSMYLPVGAVLGALGGVAVALLRRVHWLRALGSRLTDPVALTRSNPRAFSNGVSALVAGGAFSAALAITAHDVFTRFNEPWLASGLLGVVALGVALGAAVVYGLSVSVILPLARRAPWLARPIFVPLLPVAAALGGYPSFVRAYPSFFLTYAPVRLLWLPGLAVAYLLLSIVVVRLVAWRSPSALAQRAGAAGLALLSLLALLGTALSYGDNDVRLVVEERSVGGRVLLRSYLSATDRDEDGVSFLFGAGDCDDSDPSVYPGALDPPGDGVDADCFGGDGSPELGVLARAGYARVPASVPRRPNFLLITVDALRPDHLGCFGYPRETSPIIDAFAEDAVRFERVVAPSSRSLRSIPSMLTGLYPSQIAFGDELPHVNLLPRNEFVSERLQARGYGTAAVIGTDYFNRSHGFFQGFDSVVERPHGVNDRADVVNRGLDALRGLAVEEAPFFLWVHLFNVHQPYLPDHHESRFGDDVTAEYDEEIALADEQVGRLLEAVEELGLGESTVVILASDHGEAFGEHGHFGHSETLYQEETLAVMMMRVPGISGRSVPELVTLADFTPTVLNLARLPEPAQDVPSRSLVPLMGGQGGFDRERPILSELLPDGHQPFDRKALIAGRFKLQWWVRENRYELYDLEADPGELEELSAARPERAHELLGQLRAWTASFGRRENQRAAVIAENRLERPPRRLQHRSDVGFQGVFTLLGYDLDTSDVRPGGSLTATFYYRVDSETTRNFQFLFEVTPPADHPRLHHMRSEHFPIGGRYFTTDWREGEILRDRVTITLPEDVRVGTRFTLTLSVRERGRVLPFQNGLRTIDLGSVTVPRPTRPTVVPAPTPD